MKTNLEETKTMIIFEEMKMHKIKLQQNVIRHVQSYKYLGTIIHSNGKIDLEINERLRKTGKMFNKMGTTLLRKRK